jgi:hypothetical protein
LSTGSPITSWARLLIYAGIALVVIGILIYLLDRTGIFGRLPGDIVIRRKNWTLWVPLATSLILSVLLTIILNLFRR